MLAILLSALLTQQPALQSTHADGVALSRLRSAVHMLEEDENTRRFEKAAPREVIAAWQRIQRQLPRGHPGYLDLAFVLSYYRVDYERNIERLLDPYKRWCRGKAGEESVESLPVDLGILYRKSRDPHTLITLLDLRLDGASAEIQSNIVFNIWQTNRRPVLRAIAHSPARQSALADILRFECDDSDPKGRSLFQSEITTLRALAHDPDPIVAAAARKLLAGMHSAAVIPSPEELGLRVQKMFSAPFANSRQLDERSNGKRLNDT